MPILLSTRIKAGQGRVFRTHAALLEQATVFMDFVG
jgi:hypothetical protein